MSVWQTLATQFHFEYDAADNAVVSAPSAEGATRIVPLVHQRIVSVAGPDAEKFLQGQLTCHMGEVTQLGSRLGAHCNIKGAMLSLFRVIQAEPQHFWLRAHHSSADSALQHLKKYIVFSKAQANDEQDALIGFGLMGPGAGSLAEKLCETVPTETDKCVSAGSLRIVKVPGERFEVWLPASDAESLLSKLSALAPLGTTEQWLLSEIQAGVPDLREQTLETFIPQMTNLQALKGVSFNKGCYTGQEIVTRLQHRGKLTKPMYLLASKSDQSVVPGSKINSSEKADVGDVLLSSRDAQGSLWMLAVVNKAQADSYPLSLADGTGLEIHTLPYTLDPALFEAKR